MPTAYSPHRLLRDGVLGRAGDVDVDLAVVPLLDGPRPTEALEAVLQVGKVVDEPLESVHLGLRHHPVEVQELLIWDVRDRSM